MCAVYFCGLDAVFAIQHAPYLAFCDVEVAGEAARRNLGLKDAPRRCGDQGGRPVAASVFAGLLGPVAIAVCAVIFSVPVWGAWWWLAHNG